MKRKSLLLDALLGCVLTVLVAAAYVLRWPALEALELKSYDWRSRLNHSLDAGGKDIAVITIDDDSIARLGRWPWPRTRLAEMIDRLAAAGPKVVGLGILLSEAEQNQGLQAIGELQARYQELRKARRIVERPGTTFASDFSSAAVRLDADARLEASMASFRRLVLPMYFDEGGVRGAKPEPLPPAVSSSALVVRAGGLPAELLQWREASRATPPLPRLAAPALGVGHVNVYPDLDGVVRAETLVVKYGDEHYPSYALMIAARYLGFEPGDVVVEPGRAVHMGSNAVPIDESQSMLITFSANERPFRGYSFHEVLDGKVSMDVFKDKVVLIGPSAAGISTLWVTPVAHNLPSVEVVASVVENILDGKYRVRPLWALQAELGAIALMGLFLMLGLPRLRALGGALAAAVLLAGVLGAGTWFFLQGQWLKMVYPGFLLVAGYTFVTTRRFLSTERGKELVEASAVETNKMLGLSFQGQGMLDLAFDKLRACPLDDQLKELLYNLGLDFERKRQYSKAVSVYQHIASRDPGHKDIKEKMKMLKAAAEGTVFGGIGGPAKEGTVLVADGASKPTLGRYEIEKELGRGAMGIVYLGKDPKINRRVAIKTMMLEEGTDPAAVKETKERFFREAESAGTLNHPNIVRIFDAGEDHDVCYIAMEMLDGEDLTRHTARDSLLPCERAMEYVALCAEALDYAHAQGIVHRDVKPANVMVLKDGTVRVMDFGIARITASSKTATGTIMGTPSYMSPEQVAGKKVDGRSDLFSLGIALFELLTGEKPFKGGEGIGTLLFQIANDPEPEPLEINPSLPRCVSAIIHRALKKSPEERYQRGAQVAADLRACSASLKGGEAAVPKGTAPLGAEPTSPIETTQPVPAPLARGPVRTEEPQEGAPRTPEEVAAAIGGTFELTMPAEAPAPDPGTQTLKIDPPENAA